MDTRRWPRYGKRVHPVFFNSYSVITSVPSLRTAVIPLGLWPIRRRSKALAAWRSPAPSSMGLVHPAHLWWLRPHCLGKPKPAWWNPVGHFITPASLADEPPDGPG